MIPSLALHKTFTSFSSQTFVKHYFKVSTVHWGFIKCSYALHKFLENTAVSFIKILQKKLHYFRPPTLGLRDTFISLSKKSDSKDTKQEVGWFKTLFSVMSIKQVVADTRDSFHIPWRTICLHQNKRINLSIIRKWIRTFLTPSRTQWHPGLNNYYHLQSLKKKVFKTYLDGKKACRKKPLTFSVAYFN